MITAGFEASVMVRGFRGVGDGDAWDLDANFQVGAHAPNCRPSLKRRTGVDLATYLYLGVTDDVILYQYDHPVP